MRIKDSRKRIQYISNLSVIAIIGVVFLHVNEVFWEYSNEGYWIFANIIENIFYFSAPIFFMITGAMLMDYRNRYGTKEYFKRRFIKTVIPFTFWSIIALLFQFYIKNSINISFLKLTTIINNILNANYLNYYWFFPALFGIYLCIPVFAVIKEEFKCKAFKYILVVSLMFNFLIPFLSNIFHWNISMPINVSICGDYLIYAILGYILHNEEFSKKKRIIIYLFALTGLLMNLFGTQILSHKFGRIIKTYRGYNNIPCILYSAGIFLLIKNLSEEVDNRFNRGMNTISQYTFSIYLVHGFILQIMKKIYHFNIYSISYRLYMPFIIIIICIGITYGVRKIPILKRVLP